MHSCYLPSTVAVPQKEGHTLYEEERVATIYGRSLQEGSKLQYIPSLDCYGLVNIFSSSSSSISLIDPNRNPNLAPFASCQYDYPFLAMQYLPHRNQVVASSQNKILRYYTLQTPASRIDDEGAKVRVPRLQLLRQHLMPLALLGLLWDEEVERLFATNRNGELLTFLVDDRIELLQSAERTRKVHENVAIADLISLPGPNPKRIVTAGMDGHVRITDVLRGVEMYSFECVDHAGVRSLSHSPDYSFIVTTGFDYEPQLFIPGSLKNAFAGKLSDHLHPHRETILGAKCVVGTPQVVTGDASGVFKIWDIRMTKVVQSFEMDRAVVSDARRCQRGMSFLLDPVRKNIVTTFTRSDTHNTKLAIWRPEIIPPLNPHLCHSEPITAVIHTTPATVFVTASVCDIRVWNCADGRRVSSFDHISKTEITAIDLDFTNQRFFIGNNSGTVASHSLVTGDFLVFHPKHSKEISFMAYLQKEYFLITASQDGTIFCTSVPNAEVCAIPFAEVSIQAAITCGHYSDSLQLLFVADDQGSIIIFDSSLAILARCSLDVAFGLPAKSLKMSPTACLSRMCSSFGSFGIYSEKLESPMLTKRNDMSRASTRPTSRDGSRPTSRERYFFDSSRPSSRDGQRPISRDGARTSSRDATKSSAREARPSSRDGATRDGARPSSRDGATRDGARPSSRDGTKILPKMTRDDGARPSSRDGSRPISRDGSRPISRDGSRPISRDGSYPISRDGSRPISRDKNSRITIRDYAQPSSRDGTANISSSAMHHNSNFNGGKISSIDASLLSLSNTQAFFENGLATNVDEVDPSLPKQDLTLLTDVETNFATDSQLNYYKNDPFARFVVVHMLSPFHCFVAADTQSMLSIWTIRPYKYVAVSRWRNHQPRTAPFVGVISSICWIANTQTMIASDDQGFIFCWLLKDMLATVFDVASPRNTLSAEPPVLIRCWQAHYAAITCLLLSSNESILLSSSSDCRVLLWSLEGKCVGALEQGGNLGADWQRRPYLFQKKLIADGTTDEQTLLSTMFDDENKDILFDDENYNETMMITGCGDLIGSPLSSKQVTLADLKFEAFVFEGESEHKKQSLSATALFLNSAPLPSTPPTTPSMTRSISPLITARVNTNFKPSTALSFASGGPSRSTNNNVDAPTTLRKHTIAANERQEEFVETKFIEEIPSSVENDVDNEADQVANENFSLNFSKISAALLSLGGSFARPNPSPRQIPNVVVAIASDPAWMGFCDPTHEDYCPFLTDQVKDAVINFKPFVTLSLPLPTPAQEAFSSTFAFGQKFSRHFSLVSHRSSPAFFMGVDSFEITPRPHTSPVADTDHHYRRARFFSGVSSARSPSSVSPSARRSLSRDSYRNRFMSSSSSSYMSSTASPRSDDDFEIGLLKISRTKTIESPPIFTYTTDLGEDLEDFVKSTKKPEQRSIETSYDYGWCQPPLPQKISKLELPLITMISQTPSWPLKPSPFLSLDRPPRIGLPRVRPRIPPLNLDGISSVGDMVSYSPVDSSSSSSDEDLSFHLVSPATTIGETSILFPSPMPSRATSTVSSLDVSVNGSFSISKEGESSSRRFKPKKKSPKSKEQKDKNSTKELALAASQAHLPSCPKVTRPRPPQLTGHRPPGTTLISKFSIRSGIVTPSSPRWERRHRRLRHGSVFRPDELENNGEISFGRSMLLLPREGRYDVESPGCRSPGSGTPPFQPIPETPATAEGILQHREITSVKVSPRLWLSPPKEQKAAVPPPTTKTAPRTAGTLHESFQNVEKGIVLRSHSLQQRVLSLEVRQILNKTGDFTSDLFGEAFSNNKRRGGTFCRPRPVRFAASSSSKEEFRPVQHVASLPSLKIGQSVERRGSLKDTQQHVKKDKVKLSLSKSSEDRLASPRQMTHLSKSHQTSVAASRETKGRMSRHFGAVRSAVMESPRVDP